MAILGNIGLFCGNIHVFSPLLKENSNEYQRDYA